MEACIGEGSQEKLDTPPVREYFESVGLDVRAALMQQGKGRRASRSNVPGPGSLHVKLSGIYQVR